MDVWVCIVHVNNFAFLFVSLCLRGKCFSWYVVRAFGARLLLDQQQEHRSARFDTRSAARTRVQCAIMRGVPAPALPNERQRGNPGMDGSRQARVLLPSLPAAQSEWPAAIKKLLPGVKLGHRQWLILVMKNMQEEASRCAVGQPSSLRADRLDSAPGEGAALIQEVGNDVSDASPAATPPAAPMPPSQPLQSICAF